MRKLFSQILEKEVLQPMAKCQFCDKGVSFGIKVSHSHRRSNRTWKPNVKRVKAIVDGKPQHVYACTRCLRSGEVTRAVCIAMIAPNKARPIGRAFFASWGVCAACPAARPRFPCVKGTVSRQTD